MSSPLGHEDVRTLGAVLGDTRRRLAEAGIPDAAVDARVLIGGVLRLTTLAFHTSPDRMLSDDEWLAVEAAVARRLLREPVHRILGHREFHGLTLQLSTGTLEPRPDTEILVDACLPHLERITRLKGRADIVDLGTGTGAIALAVLNATSKTIATGVDISEDALGTATANAVRLGLASRFIPVKSHWADNLTGRFDLVVSNPPYIVTSVLSDLDPEVRLYDPQAALDGGEDGLDAYRSICAAMPSLLAEGGIIALEIGYDQKASVTEIFERAGYRLLESAKDYGGNDRVLLFSLSDQRD